MQIKLTDGTWVEGEGGKRNDYDPTTFANGVWVEDAHHSVGAETVPLGKRVFVPYSSIRFVVIEE